MAQTLWYSLAQKCLMVTNPSRLGNLRKNFVTKLAYSTQQAIDINQFASTQFVTTDNRQLYNQNSLGIDKLHVHRASVAQFYKRNKDEYIERLSSFVEKGDIGNLVQDDLIDLIGLADNEKHLDLIEKMLDIFAVDQKFFASGWGTAIMRLYYVMNQYDRANRSIRAEVTYGELFNKKSCYRVAMTMLFNAGRYQDVVDIYEIACKKLKPTERNNSIHHPGLSIIAFASYAKLNTPDSLANANKLYAIVDINLFSSYLRMRVITFLVQLYINQGQPIVALNMISDSPFKNHVTLRELKTLALVESERFDDITRHILTSLNNVERDDKLILRDVYKKLHSSLENIKDDQIYQQLKSTLDELMQNNLIADVTLESLLYTGINNQKVGEKLNFRPIGMANRLQRLRLKAQRTKMS